MVVFSLLVPQPFVWMGQNISIDLSGIPFLKENFPSFGFVNMLLCVIMFGMGMTLKADDFKYIFKKPTDVLIGICSQYVFMAGFGWLVASLLSLTGVGDPTVRAQIAVGLVLLGCVPGGTASNVMTFLAKGDVALSITITMCTTLLAPVLTPSLTLVLAGQWIDVNFWNMFISIVLVVLAVVLSLILSNHMSKPIREMSGEAAKLALGDYNVNFDGGNCTETVNLSAALNKAAYELSRLDKMQKDLIANVSHDLRTPLTMIAGYTEAMRDLPGEATPENMQIVIDETNRLTTLVNDMLEVSRYQNGTQKLNVTHFNLTNVIRTTIERYAKLREKDGYTIKFESDRDIFVNADEQRILQVIYNLIGNAVNYAGEDKTVIIRQTVENGEALLEVIDHGIGIPEDQLPMVWERYYKVNDFHKRANIGTGLGLSIVKNILLLHGAQFGVKSKVGEGSNFWFKLKTADEAPDNK